MVLSPSAAHEDWFAGHHGLRLVEAPEPGWRGRVGADGISAVAGSGEIALAFAGTPATAEVAAARAAGLRLLWLATGRELAAPGRLDEIVMAGVEAIHLWLHAASAPAHDFHAGAPGRFDAAARALARARARGVAVAVSSLLTRSSAPVLAALPAWLQGEGVAAWRVATIEVQGPASRSRRGVGPLDGLVPRLSVALPHALQALTRAARLGLPGFIAGAPACLLGPLVSAALPGPARAFAPGCAACPARAGCCGVAAGQLERFGDDELRAAHLRPAGPPVAGPRWMFVGTGLLRHVPSDMADATGTPAAARRRLPVLADGGGR